jgi:hypothetical protein
MGMLQNLVAAYIEIDKITTESIVACSSAAEAFVYLIDYEFVRYPYLSSSSDITTQSVRDHGIAKWREYMDYVQREVDLGPGFAVWDKHTSEIETLAQKALSDSQEVLLAHNAPDKRLPSALVDGIYARVKTLRWWKLEYLDPVRARDHYQEWKMRQPTAATPQSHCKRRAMLGVRKRADVSSAEKERAPTPSHQSFGV